MTQTIELSAGDLRLAVRADLGGCITGLWHRGQAVLRSTEPAQLGGAGSAGCFVTAPYGDRLGFSRFRWAGAEHCVVANVEGSPHAVDGVVWQRPWQSGQADPAAAELICTHTPDEHWPYAFELTHRIELSADELMLRLTLRNSGPSAQPVGLGWHPFFPRRSRSRLHVELTDRWDTDATQLPTRRVPQPGIDANVAHLAFDHCFDGWTGAARLRDERFSLRLTSSLDHLVVHTPTNVDWYCVQPLSHVSNAIHMADPLAHGLQRLQPGESAQAWMKLEIAAI